MITGETKPDAEMTKQVFELLEEVNTKEPRPGRPDVTLESVSKQLRLDVFPELFAAAKQAVDAHLDNVDWLALRGAVMEAEKITHAP